MNGNNGQNTQQNNKPPLLLEESKEFPMIWAIAISVVATAIVVGGGVYLMQKSVNNKLQNQIKEMQANLELSADVVDLPEEEQGTVQVISNETVVQQIQEDIGEPAEVGGHEYTNHTYGFSLVFPASWGDIQESGPSGVTPSVVENMITLKSKGDIDRYIYISIVKLKNKDNWAITDMPSLYAKENNKYAFYYNGSGDCAGKPSCEAQKYFDLQSEVKNIIKTFTVQNLVLSVTDKIETWSLYIKDNNVIVGTGNCGNQEFEDLLLNANSGDRKVLDINGLKLVYTPKYFHRSNEEFIGFNDDNTAICGAGGIYPLHVFSDKLLWRGVCGSGMASSPGTPEDDALRACETTLQLVNEYFEN